MDWVHNKDLDFKLKVVKNSDGDYEHVQDMFINNITFRPLQLEQICCYDMITHYELKKMIKKILNQKTLI